MKRHRVMMTAWAATLGGAGSICNAQSLFQRPVDPPPPGMRVDVSAPLRGMSLFAIEPPEPKSYQKHDTLQIIINENSLQSYEQSLETEKDYDLEGSVKGLPSIRHLLEAQLRPGTGELIAPEANLGKSFEGDGEYERKDRFTTRVSGQVLEVKPNGLLVIEAKKTYTSDDESVVLVVSGVCRAEDVTSSNTIESTRLANLVIHVKHEGEVRDAAKRGIIPRVLDTIFNF